MPAQWLKDYYKGGKRITIDGVPCRVPKWWGTLGNDKEFRAATRETYNKAHYPEGTIRIVRNGIPYRYPDHVKKWKPANRAALDQGFDRYGLTLRPHGKYGFTDKQDTLYARYGSLAWRLSHARREAEWQRERYRQQFPPDLFVWGRWNAKAQRAAKWLHQGSHS